MFNPLTNAPYPLPNIKSIVQATMKPDLRAILDILYPEIEYMRSTVEAQNKTITDLQKLIAKLQLDIDAYTSHEHATAFKVTEHEHGKVSLAKFYEHAISVKNQLATMQFLVDKVRDDMINIHLWKNAQDKKLIEFRDNFLQSLSTVRDDITTLTTAIDRHEVTIQEVTNLKANVIQLEADLQNLNSRVTVNEVDLHAFKTNATQAIAELSNRVKRIEDHLNNP